MVSEWNAHTSTSIISVYINNIKLSGKGHLMCTEGNVSMSIKVNNAFIAYSYLQFLQSQ